MAYLQVCTQETSLPNLSRFSLLVNKHTLLPPGSLPLTHVQCISTIQVKAFALCVIVDTVGLPAMALAVIRVVSILSLVLWTGIIIRELTSMNKNKVKQS